MARTRKKNGQRQKRREQEGQQLETSVETFSTETLAATSLAEQAKVTDSHGGNIAEAEEYVAEKESEGLETAVRGTSGSDEEENSSDAAKEKEGKGLPLTGGGDSHRADRYSGEEEVDVEEEEHLLQTEYEKQRERRIKDNQAKLGALNLHSLASSFANPELLPAKRRQSCRQGKRKSMDIDKAKYNDDDDYQPSDDSTDSEMEDGDDPKKQANRVQQANSADEEGNEALQEALALSLECYSGNREVDKASIPQKNKRRLFRHDVSTTKQRRGTAAKLKFSIEEVATIFSLIDEKGAGKFSVVELERVAQLHDFTWSTEELKDMIDIFDGNKDGKLDMTEFQDIFLHTGMLKLPPPSNVSH